MTRGAWTEGALARAAVTSCFLDRLAATATAR